MLKKKHEAQKMPDNSLNALTFQKGLEKSERVEPEICFISINHSRVYDVSYLFSDLPRKRQRKI